MSNTWIKVQKMILFKAVDKYSNPAIRLHYDCGYANKYIQHLGFGTAWAKRKSVFNLHELGIDYNKDVTIMAESAVLFTPKRILIDTDDRYRRILDREF